MTEKVTEYILLKAVRENVDTRGFLLHIDFESLERIENNKWILEVPDSEKPIVRSIIQMDIISKILMYIEDVVVLAESFIASKNFYNEFLRPSADFLGESDDLGEVIKGFFGRVERLSDHDVLKIMSWIDMPSFIPDNGLKQLVTKIQSDNILKIRNILIEWKDFGNSNHPIYKRFKHGGIPIVPYSRQLEPRTGPLASFDMFSIVSEGDNPMEDIHIIPFSNEVLQKYKTFIARIQSILLGMIDNRIVCIQRDISNVFPNIPKTYSNEATNPLEIGRLEKIIDEYYLERPAVFVPKNVNYNLDIPDIKEKIKWYFNTYQ